MSNTDSHEHTERVCMNHCAHSPAWMKDGSCTAFVGESIQSGVSKCRHVCTFSEPAKRFHRCPAQACVREEGHDGNHCCSVCNWPHRLDATELEVAANEKYDEHECYPPNTDEADPTRPITQEEVNTWQ